MSAERATVRYNGELVRHPARDPRTRPFLRRIRRRLPRPRFPWRSAALAAILCSHGAAFGGTAFFQPLLHIYTTGTAATETILGGTNVAVEVWAGGGSGGAGSGSGCSAVKGGGGGSGSKGYTPTFSIAAQVGKTFTYTVGPGGAASSNPGTASSISAGTVTGWTTISTNPGGAGGNTGAAGAAGTAGTGATTNTAGNAGSTGASGGAAGAGVAGSITGDGAPYGAGGAGGAAGSGHAGFAGQTGAVVFYYT